MEKEFITNITKIVILQDKLGCDTVSLHTDLPTTMPKVTNQPLILEFRVAQGDGREYVTKTLGLPFELINIINI